jgi:pyridoxine kinase
VELMREMVGVADLIFPNYTEACYLTGTPYKSEGMTEDEAWAMLDQLEAIGTRSALITSATVNGHHCVVGKRSSQPVGFAQQAGDGLYFRLNYEEIPGLFHGTGDIFSAVLIGHLLNGETLRQATQTAMDVVSRLIERNRDLPDKCRGIPIEQCLDLL